MDEWNIKNNIKIDKKTYEETCNTYEWKVPLFSENAIFVTQYNETLKLFSEFNSNQLSSYPDIASNVKTSETLINR